MHSETPYLARHKDLHTSKAWGMDQTQQLQVVHSSLCVALLPSSVALFMSVPPEATFRCNTWILMWINELKSNEIAVQINEMLEPDPKAILDHVS